MKLTQKQLNEFLQTIGLADVELVDDETQVDFDPNTALSSIDGNRRKILEPQLRTEIEEAAKSAAEGRVLGGIRAMLARNTGLSHSKLKEYGEDKMEDAIKAAIAHKVSQLEGDSQQTAAKIEEILQKNSEALAAKDTEWQGKYDELNNRYVSRDMLEYFETKLKDAPLPEKLDKKIAAKDFMSYLKEKYHLSHNEAEKAVALMDKANPALPALNEAKNAQIDIMAEAKSFFEPRALWMTDMRGVNPADAMQGKGGLPTVPANPMPNGNQTPQAQRAQRLASYGSQG